MVVIGGQRGGACLRAATLRTFGSVGPLSLPALGRTGMICPRCLGKRLVLIVRLDDGASLVDQAATTAYEQECPECHRFGVVHCCDGLTACAEPDTAHYELSRPKSS